MANDIDDELYPDNDDFIAVVPTTRRLNATTGIEETVPLTGLTNLKAYLATTAEAASDASAISGLVVALTEVGSTGAYQGSMTGAAKRTNLAATADGTTLYLHWQSGTVYHEVKSVIWRTKRPAA